MSSSCQQFVGRLPLFWGVGEAKAARGRGSSLALLSQLCCTWQLAYRSPGTLRTSVSSCRWILAGKWSEFHWHYCKIESRFPFWNFDSFFPPFSPCRHTACPLPPSPVNDWAGGEDEGDVWGGPRTWPSCIFYRPDPFCLPAGLSWPPLPSPCRHLPHPCQAVLHHQDHVHMCV